MRHYRIDEVLLDFREARKLKPILKINKFQNTNRTENKSFQLTLHTKKRDLN